MADESNPGAAEQGASRGRANLAVARARLRGAMGTTAPDLSAAAARAVAEFRLGLAQRTGQIGFLNDVVDFVDDVADATVEVLNHFAANTEEVTHLLEDVTPEVTPVIVTLFATGLEHEGAGGGPVIGPADPRGASAKEILEARNAILETTAAYRKGFAAMAQSLRAQLAAMRRPTP